MRSAKETGRAARSTPRSEQETTSSTPIKLAVAAIDFGTTYSGYAYSFRSDFKNNPLNIVTNIWKTGGGEGLVTEKTPTTILFEPNGEFHSFGYEAEDQYAELAEEDEHENWHYFSRFKMKLHGQAKIRREMKLRDDQGHQMPAMKVFSEAIKYLKNHLLKRMREKILVIKDTDIHWVITVPAIWDDGAKQFMREAGKELVYSAVLSPSNVLTVTQRYHCIYRTYDDFLKKLNQKTEKAIFIEQHEKMCRKRDMKGMTASSEKSENSENTCLTSNHVLTPGNENNI